MRLRTGTWAGDPSASLVAQARRSVLIRCRRVTHRRSSLANRGSSPRLPLGSTMNMRRSANVSGRSVTNRGSSTRALRLLEKARRRTFTIAIVSCARVRQNPVRTGLARQSVVFVRRLGVFLAYISKGQALTQLRCPLAASIGVAGVGSADRKATAERDTDQGLAPTRTKPRPRLRPRSMAAIATRRRSAVRARPREVARRTHSQPPRRSSRRSARTRRRAGRRERRRASRGRRSGSS